MKKVPVSGNFSRVNKKTEHLEKSVKKKIPYYLEIFQALSGRRFIPETCPETYPEIDNVQKLFQNKGNFSILSVNDPE